MASSTARRSARSPRGWRSLVTGRTRALPWIRRRPMSGERSIKAPGEGAPYDRAIPRPVWFLGWTSLFTDAATEMIYPLLPIYLSRVLGASALSLGIIEGVAEAVNSLLKVLSGHFSDRWARRRPIVIAGYALSSLARPLIAITST